MGLAILMTADAVGGVWQYSCDLACELARAGHTVTIAGMGPEPSAAQRREIEGDPAIRLVWTDLPLDWLSEGPEPVVRAAETLAEMAGQGGFDLVHCNMPSLAGAADWPVPLVAVAHGCVATWWEAARVGPLDPAMVWHRDLTRKGLASAHAVVAPSAAHAATLARHYALSRTPRVVHNGRRLLTRPGHNPAPLPAALTVGRLWDPVKNAALLDKVAAAIPVPFMAAGALRGPNGEHLAPANLQSLGELPAGELAGLLALHPVFVSAATFEPFGLSVLEAAAAGCPLVLSDIPTFRELWDGAALFVDPRSADAFAEAIGSVLSDRARHRLLGEAAMERSRRFTPAATGAAMAAIYREVLRQAEIAA